MYHDEPSFQQMLTDPIVRLIMGSDGVTPPSSTAYGRTSASA
jgi:hypothetical protein